MNILILSYYLTTALTRYSPMIWNLWYSDHLFVLTILLYYSNHSLGSSTSISLNFISFMWFDSLSTWFILKFAPVKAFTNITTLRSNPFRFFPDSKLNSPSNSPLNPDDSNGDSELLLLLLPEVRLTPQLFFKWLRNCVYIKNIELRLRVVSCD